MGALTIISDALDRREIMDLRCRTRTPEARTACFHSRELAALAEAIHAALRARAARFWEPFGTVAGQDRRSLALERMTRDTLSVYAEAPER